MNKEAVAEWFARERGITRETLRAFGVGFDSDRGNVLLPYPNGTKERPDPTQPPDPNRKRFYWAGHKRGDVPALFHSPSAGGEAAFLVEGETDAMRLWQELGGKTPVFGIGGVNTWRPEVLIKTLEPYSRVYTILDNDDYQTSHVVDGVWRELRREIGRAKRVHLPLDVKDVCEFFDRYDVETLHLLTQKSGQSRFKPIDFSAPPPPVRWLLDGWIAMGDVTVLAGMGGLGKSWVTMALAMAVLNGHASLLGHDVHEHGRVLYVDEENPLDVVYSRMLRMGLNPTGSGDLRFLWNQGIRLDRESGERLLDEALDFKPTFMALDSLSRLHSSEENAAGEIGRILNDNLKPLARDTGAGVVVIHHHDKQARGPRGSTDIVNAADAVIEVYDAGYGSNQFRMVLTKSRRKERGAEILVGVNDQPDGTVKVAVQDAIDLSNTVF